MFVCVCACVCVRVCVCVCVHVHACTLQQFHNILQSSKVVFVPVSDDNVTNTRIEVLQRLTQQLEVSRPLILTCVHKDPSACVENTK